MQLSESQKATVRREREASTDALREVAAFAGLRRLLLLSIAVNPALESLSGLHALEQLERCNVNSNATLCISEVFEVCGDLEVPPAGLTDNNDDGC